MADKPPATVPLSLAEVMAEGVSVTAAKAGPARRRRRLKGVIAAAPRHGEALHQLGLLALDAGRPRVAAGLLRRAVGVAPGRAGLWFSLGRALISLGRHGDAADTLRRARALKLDFAPIHFQLGRALHGQGKPDLAMAAFHRALDLDPRHLAAHLELGNTLGSLGEADRAMDCYRRALDIEPGFHLARYNMGNLYLEQERFDDDARAYRRTIADAPDYGPAHNNLGAALQHVGDHAGAEAAHRKAIAVDPEFAQAHVNLGMVRLRFGDFTEGFDEYQWRWKSSTWPTPPRTYEQPLWDGSAPLTGKTILLYGEQGIGDIIQFIRYAPLIAERAGRVVVESPAALERLLATVGGIDQLTAKDAPLPDFDVHAPLLDLPRALGTTVHTVPAVVPYVAARPDDVARWRRRIGRRGRLKVGLVWAGRAEHSNDRNRSIALDRLRPLFDVPKTRFFSLQVGDRAADPSDLGLDRQIEDLSADLTDFAETAAALSVLDLLITVDTAPAHLAGALGRPVWILVPFRPDWRWLLERGDSPWYPSMQLFRQPEQADWDRVVMTLRDKLTALAAGDG